MEKLARHNENIHDQENAYVSKKIGLTKRVTTKVNSHKVGALIDINTNTNIETRADIAAIKNACEDKKAGNRLNTRGYKHVQSKVDTGLAVRNIQPSSRPPLRREESTGRLAIRAVAPRNVLKEVQNNVNELKGTINVMTRQAKKIEAEKKKLPVVKEYVKEIRCSRKSDVTVPTESLGKIKLDEKKQEDKVTTPDLPIDIEDVDAGDSNIALLMTPYIKDIYRYLLQLEKKYAINKNHLAKQQVITGPMRATLVDWMVEVQRQFSLELETFHLAVGIVDRYLQVVNTVPTSRLQLVGITAMFIASKYEEVYSPHIGEFIYLTDNAYTMSDILKCEIEILSKLGFCLARPIPLSFLRRFVKIARGTAQNHHLAKYLVDLSLVEYNMAHYRPSELAAAAICLSIHLISKKSLSEIWTPTLVYYSEYTLDHIAPIIYKIAKIVVNVECCKHKTVYKKYLDASLAKVSKLPELKSEAINNLAKKAI